MIRRWGPFEIDVGRRSNKSIQVDDRTYELIETMARLTHESVGADGKARRADEPVRPVTERDIEAVLKDVVHLHYQQYCMRR